MKKHYSTLAGLFLAMLSTSLLATPTDFGEGLANLDPPRRLTNAQQQHQHWSGVGRIRNESETLCTASLLDTRDEQGRSGPAYVVTSSHCTHRVNGAVQKDLPIKGNVSFNYFDDTLEQLKTYPLKILRWGSSQGVDLALIELVSPLSELINNGIEPLKLADQVPPTDTPILTLSAPQWEMLQVSACSQQSSDEIVEQPFVWRVTLKNQCLGSELGGFGGPLLERSSNRLFAISSTTTIGQNAEKKCQRNAPCEIKNGIPEWGIDTNYASPVTFLKGCFVEGVLQANANTCNLYPTTSIHFHNPEPIQQYFVQKNGEKDTRITPHWNLEFTTNTPFYRYKVTRRAIDCENPVSYSSLMKADNAYINDAIGPQTGMHMLCIVGVESAEQPATA